MMCVHLYGGWIMYTNLGGFLWVFNEKPITLFQKKKIGDCEL